MTLLNLHYCLYVFSLVWAPPHRIHLACVPLLGGWIFLFCCVVLISLANYLTLHLLCLTFINTVLHAQYHSQFTMQPYIPFHAIHTHIHCKHTNSLPSTPPACQGAPDQWLLEKAEAPPTLLLERAARTHGMGHDSFNEPHGM